MKPDKLDQFDIQQLRAFDAIYRLRSATKAAHRLHLTPSAMSHTLAKLRKVFDEQLFVRSSHSLIPTAKADRLHPKVVEVLDRLDALVTPEDVNPQEFDEEINLTISDYASFVLLPHLVKRLENDAPKLRLFCHAWSPDTELQMERGEIDLAIGYRARGDKIERQKLYTDPFVCVVRQNHPLKPKRKVDGKGISRHELAFVAVAGETPPREFWEAVNIRSPVTLKLAYFLAAPMVMAKSDRVIFMPSSIADSTYFKRVLRIVPTTFSLHSIQYNQFWHQRVESDLVIGWLRQVIAEESNRLNLPPRVSH